MLNPGTTTTQDFGMFLYILRVYLDRWFNHGGAEVVITVDNVSIHWTSQAKETAAKLNMRIIGLPPYWPHLAPVELVFGYVKNHIRRQCISNSVDYSKTSGKRTIIKGLEGLTSQVGYKMWKKVVQTSKHIIVEASQDKLRSEQANTDHGLVDEELKLMNLE